MCLKCNPYYKPGLSRGTHEGSSTRKERPSNDSCLIMPFIVIYRLLVQKQPICTNYVFILILLLEPRGFIEYKRTVISGSVRDSALERRSN